MDKTSKSKKQGHLSETAAIFWGWKQYLKKNKNKKNKNIAVVATERVIADDGDVFFRLLDNPSISWAMAEASCNDETAIKAYTSAST